MQQEDAGGRWDSRQGDRDLLMVGQPGPRTLLPARAAWQTGGEMEPLSWRGYRA